MTRRPNTLASMEYAPGPSRPSAAQLHPRAIMVSALSLPVTNAVAMAAAASTNATIRVPNPTASVSAKATDTTIEAFGENCGTGRCAITSKAIHAQASLSSTSAIPAAASGKRDKDFIVVTIPAVFAACNPRWRDATIPRSGVPSAGDQEVSCVDARSWEFLAVRLRKALLTAATLLVPCAALADGSPRGLADYTHQSWTEATGAPAPVLEIAQGRDGFLWLATGEG